MYEIDLRKRYFVTIKEIGYHETTYPNSEIIAIGTNFIHFAHKNKKIIYTGNVVIKVEEYTVK